MSFPLEKYHYYETENKTIAVSTYAGKPVRGTAICAAGDEFSAAAGKEIAAARCNVRVCEKRRKRAAQKHQEAKANLAKAAREFERMISYLEDATRLEEEAKVELNAIIAKY